MGNKSSKKRNVSDHSDDYHEQTGKKTKKGNVLSSNKVGEKDTRSQLTPATTRWPEARPKQENYLIQSQPVFPVDTPATRRERLSYSQGYRQGNPRQYEAHTPDTRVLERQLQSKTEQVEHLTTELEQLRRRCETSRLELERQTLIQQRLQNDVKELTNRLSAEMGKKLATDESALENVSIRNRPMNVADDYHNFCSSEWLNAKEYLDDKDYHLSEVDKLQLLADIILEAEKVASKAYITLMAQTENLLKRLPIFRPVGEKESMLDEDTISNITLPLELTNLVRDIMRKRSAHTDKSRLVKDIKKSLGKENCRWRSVIKKKCLRAYLEKCCSLTWDMMLQTPQMRFSCEGVGEGWRGDSYQTVHYLSEDPNNPQHKVVLYVHPALHHHNKLMVKGNVYIAT